MSNIRNTDADPFKGELLGYEINKRKGELESQFAAVMADQDNVGQIINLEHVFFKTGSSELSDNSKYELDNVASFLKQNGSIGVELGGHTDSQGDDSANQVLSQSRAQAVQSYLARKGIVTDRMSAKGYGEDSPVETNDTAEGRQANRRTELKITSK